MVGAVVATHAAKDDAVAAVGRAVSQGCAVVVEKVFARACAENETREVAGYMEEPLNEMLQARCWVLHPRSGRGQSDAVGTTAVLGRTEVGVLALTAGWGAGAVGFAVEDKRC